MNKTRLQRENSITYLGAILMTSCVGQTTLTIYLVNLPDALVCSADCAIMFQEKLFACSIMTYSLFTNSIWHINLGYCYKTVNKKNRSSSKSHC